MQLLVLALGALTLTGFTKELRVHDQLADHYECMRYGFKPETDTYARCRMIVVQNRENRPLTIKNYAGKKRSVLRNLKTRRENVQEKPTHHMTGGQGIL
jgi:hypothetical protein